MAKSKTKSSEPRKPRKGDSKKDGNKKPPEHDGVRETIDSIVIAFILAFLFRAYEAEAFVIPTGSMAPTLYGRHKDVDCAECGYHFTIGASDEVDDGYFLGERFRVLTAFCPNCRYENPVKKLPVFTGDRILVNKYPFEFGDPQRWDVTVFKFPEEPNVNYIKRLVGLPNETIVLRRGNVYRREPDGSDAILRKHPDKQAAIQLVVYDDVHPPRTLLEAGYPERWAAVEPAAPGSGVAGWSDDENGFMHDAQSRTFEVAAADADGKRRWIRYRHYFPSENTWDAASKGFGVDASADLQLITDICGYNEYTGGSPHRLESPPFWVGDLTVKCEVELKSAAKGAELLFEINEGAYRYRCLIDPATGTATLKRNVPIDPGEVEWETLADAPTEMDGPGRYRVMFANVDERLCLWVRNIGGLTRGHFGSGLVDFGEKASYKLPNTADPTPKAADLAPIGIAVKDATASVSGLVVYRDIYYVGEYITEQTARDRARTAAPYGFDNDGLSRDVEEFDSSKTRDLQERVSDPAGWGLVFENNRSDAEIKFELAADEFLMLGDNSPRSKDSRLWLNNRRARHRFAVPRSALVGRAFFVYWPHGVPFLNGGKGYGVWNHTDISGHKVPDYPSFRIPFYPNFGRMRRIR